MKKGVRSSQALSPPSTDLLPDVIQGQEAGSENWPVQGGEEEGS